MEPQTTWVRVEVYVPEPVAKQLDEAAVSCGVSKNILIVNAIEQHLHDLTKLRTRLSKLR